MGGLGVRQRHGVRVEGVPSEGRANRVLDIYTSQQAKIPMRLSPSAVVTFSATYGRAVGKIGKKWVRGSQFQVLCRSVRGHLLIHPPELQPLLKQAV